MTQHRQKNDSHVDHNTDKRNFLSSNYKMLLIILSLILKFRIKFKIYTLKLKLKNDFF